MDAEYTSLNPALSLLVATLATRWNSPKDGGPWVWNTYQAYLKVCGAPCGGSQLGSQRPDLKLPGCSARTRTRGWSGTLWPQTRLAWPLE